MNKVRFIRGPYDQSEFHFGDMPLPDRITIELDSQQFDASDPAVWEAWKENLGEDFPAIANVTNAVSRYYVYSLHRDSEDSPEYRYSGWRVVGSSK